MKNILLVALISVLAVACSNEEPAAPAAPAAKPMAAAEPASMAEPEPMVANEASYTAIHAAAAEMLDKAAAVDGEWRDARWKKSKAVKVKVGEKIQKMSYLAAAEAYAAMGDYENAVKYAEIAKFQGEAGYAQAMEQKDAGPHH